MTALTAMMATKAEPYLVCGAQGLLQLHSHRPAILHRDLKSPNLLVDKHWRVKVRTSATAIGLHQAFVEECTCLCHTVWGKMWRLLLATLSLAQQGT